jgi:predicted acetyltransferase
MNFLDKLQQAWQSQCSKSVEVNPDRILEIARLERQVHFWLDTLLIAFFIVIGVVSLGWVLRDIHKDWPWLIYTGCDAWVAGFVLISQWRRRNCAAHVDAPLLSHVEWSIKDIEQRMW